MKQLTVRGVSKELDERLKAIAKAHGESVNATALRLLEQATGISGRRERLARYVSWDQAELKGFEEVLTVQRSVDVELWK